MDITQPEGGQLDLAYLTGQKNGLPNPPAPGTEMTDEEIYALAEDLIKRGEAWEAWAGDTARYALIEADHVTWTWEGEAGVGYRLLGRDRRGTINGPCWKVCSPGHMWKRNGSIW